MLFNIWRFTPGKEKMVSKVPNMEDEIKGHFNRREQMRTREHKRMEEYQRE